MVLRLTKGCLIVDEWFEAGYAFECDGSFATAFLRSGAAVIATEYDQNPSAPVDPKQGHETTEHRGHKESERAVKKPQK